MFAVGAGLGNKVQSVRKQRLLTGDQIVVATGRLWPMAADRDYTPDFFGSPDRQWLYDLKDGFGC
jgi:hypothetical protein